MIKIDKKKWAKRAAFFAVFGITGVAAIITISSYRAFMGLDDIDWDNITL